MAYIEPLVMVYQEYAALSTSTETATLPACIIGPCYDIIDVEEDETRAYAGTYTMEGFTGAPIPGVTVGAAIDKETLRFRFKNPRVQIAESVSPNSVKVNELLFDKDTFPKDVAVGDYVRNNGSDAEYRIYSIDKDTFSFLVNKTFDDRCTVTLSVPHGNPLTPEEDRIKVAGDADTIWKILSISEDGLVYELAGTDVWADGTKITDEDRAEPFETLEGTIARSVTIERDADDFILPLTEGKLTADATSYKFTAFHVTDDTYKTVDGEDVLVSSYPVVKAELYVGCRALRQDVSSVGVAYTVDEIKANLGKIVPENPLAYGVNVALANSSDTGIYYVGVDSDDLAGYTAAKDGIESYSPLYSIVPLSQDVAILNMFKLHAIAMSEAEAGQWRIAFGNTPLPTETTLCESAKDKSGNFLATGVISKDGDGDLCWLKDPDGIFLSSSCDAGDKLVVEKGGKSYEFVVESVPTDDIIVVDQNNDFGDMEGDVFHAGDAVIYHVVHKYDKEGQAKAIAAASSSFGSMRFVHVWPDICIIDGHELPGYYLCCAVAGAISSLQPHYGLTRLSIAGITAVKHAGEYFNRSQLNTIADGGTFIFTQETPNSAPYIRHQLTSDRSAIEFQEVSFVKNFDYICYILKDVLGEYIGRYNINRSTLYAIADTIGSVLDGIMADSYPKIGSPILGYSDIRVIQSELSRDRVDAYCNVTFPYPLNTLAMHVVSQ